MLRRISEYRKRNEKGTGNPILIDFFKENNIEVLEINAENKEKCTFDALRSFIERVI